MSAWYRGLNGRHLAVRHAGEADAETIELQVETNQSHVRAALAARTRLLRDGQAARVPCRPVIERGFIAHELTFELEEGRPATVEKIVALYTSRDRAISECRLDARQAAQAATGFAELLPARGHLGHPSGDGSTSSSTAPMSGPRPSCTCTSSTCCKRCRPTPSTWMWRAGTRLAWEAYRGHIFWDELFIFPFFNLQQPRVAAALLDYRHARLGAAGSGPGGRI